MLCGLSFPSLKCNKYSFYFFLFCFLFFHLFFTCKNKLEVNLHKTGLVLSLLSGGKLYSLFSIFSMCFPQRKDCIDSQRYHTAPELIKSLLLCNYHSTGRVQTAKNSRIFFETQPRSYSVQILNGEVNSKKKKKPGNDGCSQHRGGLNSSGVPRGFHDPKLGDKRRCGMLDWNPAGTGWAASSHRGNITRNIREIPEEWKKKQGEAVKGRRTKQIHK